MGPGFADVVEDDGVLVTSAEVDGFKLAELRFPPGYVQEPYEPEVPYVAVVLEGALEKTFRRRTVQLDGACAVTMPVGATHGARFGPEGARIATVLAASGSTRAAASLDRLVEFRARRVSWLGWRLAGELRTRDAAAPLAAEGLALELLAATSRESEYGRRQSPAPGWLRSAEELLHARLDEPLRLSELAEAVGVTPAHLAQAFRIRHGVSVGEYGRRLRLAWAAAELARADTPLALVATRAGFADQSHFTRLFKRHVGLTPAQYRRETRVPN